MRGDGREETRDAIKSIEKYLGLVNNYFQVVHVVGQMHERRSCGCEVLVFYLGGDLVRLIRTGADVLGILTPPAVCGAFALIS